MWFAGKYITIDRLDNPACDIGNSHAVLVIRSQRCEVEQYLGVCGKQHGGFKFMIATCPEFQGTAVYLRGSDMNWHGSPLIVEKDKLDQLRLAFAELDNAVAKSLTKDGEVVEIDGRKYKLSLVD